MTVNISSTLISQWNTQKITVNCCGAVWLSNLRAGKVEVHKIIGRAPGTFWFFTRRFCLNGFTSTRFRWSVPFLLCDAEVVQQTVLSDVIDEHFNLRRSGFGTVLNTQTLTSNPVILTLCHKFLDNRNRGLQKHQEQSQYRLPMLVPHRVVPQIPQKNPDQ